MVGKTVKLKYVYCILLNRTHVSRSRSSFSPLPRAHNTASTKALLPRSQWGFSFMVLLQVEKDGPMVNPFFHSSQYVVEAASTITLYCFWLRFMPETNTFHSVCFCLCSAEVPPDDYTALAISSTVVPVVIIIILLFGLLYYRFVRQLTSWFTSSNHSLYVIMKSW